jgi:hypothetical protein
MVACLVFVLAELKVVQKELKLATWLVAFLVVLLAEQLVYLLAFLLVGLMVSSTAVWLVALKVI